MNEAVRVSKTSGQIIRLSLVIAGSARAQGRLLSARATQLKLAGG